jgi:excisionase family DNA binding protein
MDTATQTASVRPLAVDIAGAERLTSLSRPTLRLYIRTGQLRVTRCGRRVLIPVEALQELVRDGAPPRMKLTGGKSLQRD